jgi:hypothetical protein
MAKYQSDLDSSLPVRVSGVKGAKSKPFTKTFRNYQAFSRWAIILDEGDHEVYVVENA